MVVIRRHLDLAVGAAFQLVGLALFVSDPIGLSITARVYGYEILAGVGVGISFGTLVVLTPSSVQPRDLATATSAMIQFRQMVGYFIVSHLCSFLAICLTRT